MPAQARKQITFFHGKSETTEYYYSCSVYRKERKNDFIHGRKARKGKVRKAKEGGTRVGTSCKIRAAGLRRPYFVHVQMAFLSRI